MEATAATLTILFEEPFWIGLYERESDGRYEASKVVFGAEPKDYEVLAFLLHQRERLRFSPPVAATQAEKKRVNPKRMQRSIARQLASRSGVGTKAQQALKLQQEQGKLARKARSRAQREAEQDARFALRTQQRKEKHRGH